MSVEIARLRLTQDRTVHAPVWTPDGERVIFGWRVRGPDNLHSVPVDGSGEIESLTTGDAFDNPTAVTPDGTSVLFERRSDIQREI